MISLRCEIKESVNELHTTERDIRLFINKEIKFELTDAHVLILRETETVQRCQRRVGVCGIKGVTLSFE